MPLLLGLAGWWPHLPFFQGRAASTAWRLQTVPEQGGPCRVPRTSVPAGTAGTCCPPACPPLCVRCLLFLCWAVGVGVQGGAMPGAWRCRDSRPDLAAWSLPSRSFVMCSVTEQLKLRSSPIGILGESCGHRHSRASDPLPCLHPQRFPLVRPGCCKGNWAGCPQEPMVCQQPRSVHG